MVLQFGKSVFAVGEMEFAALSNTRSQVLTKPGTGWNTLRWRCLLDIQTKTANKQLTALQFRREKLDINLGLQQRWLFKAMKRSWVSTKE